MKRKTVIEIGIDQMTIVPPGPDKCPLCATKHPPEQPHNKDSLYYQMKFRQDHGRFPTWTDAMAHCAEDIKAYWTAQLTMRGEPLSGEPVNGVRR